MQSLIIIVHVLAAIAITCLVLLQHGKGAEVGASFGGGAANAMFGSAGAVPFLVKLTASFAAIFFLTSLSLGYLASRQEKQSNVIDLPTTPKTQVQPQSNVPKTFIPGTQDSKKQPSSE